VVEQPVHGGAGEEWIGEQASELVDVAVSGDHEGTLLVPLTNDFVQVERFRSDKGAQPEIVDREDVDLGEAGEASFVGSIAPSSPKLAEELLGQDELRRVPCSAGSQRERLGQEALAQSRPRRGAEMFSARGTNWQVAMSMI
jgi:hypothetical protein